MLSKRSTLTAMILSSAIIAAILPIPLQAQDTPATNPATPATGATPATPTTAEATAPAAPAIDIPADSPIKKLADNYLHYSIIGNLDLAHDFGQAILNKKADPRDVLTGFEQAADGRDPKIIMERNLKQPALKEVSQALLDTMEEGSHLVARDPARIKDDISKLGDSLRSYQNAKDHLTAAGQYAVPYYIQTLQNNNNQALHPYVIRVMTEVGPSLLPALVQQLNTPNDAEKLTIIPLMGEIGYPLAIPYLKAAAADDKALAEVRTAAEAALTKINERSAIGKGSAADSFQVLAQSYYDNRPSVAPAGPTEKTNPIWFFDKQLNNVKAIQVPTQIWSDVNAMRACESALRLEPTKAASISLWVGANLRRELHLPAGASDGTRAPGTPDAMFYALSAGPMYLNTVLNFSLNDRDSPLILKTLAALEWTGGTQGTVPMVKEMSNPLVRALGYPDRAVRFNAAFALGRANPARDFAGSFRVMPILCEAISQSTAPHIVLVDPDEQNRAHTRSMLTDLNYVVHAGPSLAAAMSDAANASSFDGMIIPPSEALHVAELSSSDYRLTSIPVVVMAPVASQQAITAELSHVGPLFRYAPADIDAPGLQMLIADVKKSVGTTPIDDAGAMQFALTSIGILDKLAIDKQSIFKVVDAVPALTEALKDKRPEVAIAAATALGKVNLPAAQKAVAMEAFAENVDAKYKKALLDALANSAKVAGNHVDPAIIEQLVGLVTADDGDPEIRSAAAKAVGALNVQSDQSSRLILEQAH